MDVSLLYLLFPLLVMLAFVLSGAGLIFGAVVAPCIARKRRRTAITANILGLICFVGAFMFLSSLPPRHPDDVVTIGETIGFAVTLTVFFFGVEAVVMLLHWRWSLWRASRSQAGE